MTLTDTLDKIWHAGSDAQLQAEQLAEEAPGRLVLVSTCILLCVHLQMLPTSVSVDDDEGSANLRFSAITVKVQLNTEGANAVVRYKDSSVQVGISSDPVFDVDFSNLKLANFLFALEYARDHSDTLVFLPPDIRTSRIVAIAESIEFSEENFRFLLGKYPAIARMFLDMTTLVAIEGADGAGKNTCANALCERLQSSGVHACIVSFPRYTDTVGGWALGEFLSGRLERTVSPKVAAVLYAVDRLESAEYIEKMSTSADVIVFDRYIGSNIAYQAAKVHPSERSDFMAWIADLETKAFSLPMPHLSVFLDTPQEVAQSLISKEESERLHDRYI